MPHTTLKMYDSFKKEKIPFVPRNGKHVSWYSCGPTVYDVSHMGHARSYISFDILRRVLSGYFGYDVFYVMNITDIDDKIIKKARQDYLYEKYLNEKRPVDQVLADGAKVVLYVRDQIRNAQDPALRTVYEGWRLSMNLALDPLQKTLELGGGEQLDQALKNFLVAGRGPFSAWLDKEVGHSVTDNSIFAEVPRKFEKEFHEDMAALNVRPPDVLTRVSEYIPEIIDYIKVIIDNGYAYESNGSVYFSISKFKNSGKHTYAKLVPEAIGDAAKLQEGEGELSVSRDKRSELDFALWKASKPGEPSWMSPWGKGRPGWHIECSVMASAVCGDSLDIHTGGVDLKFPHHDNEIAQAEAYFESDDWVKYFFHAGHLTIAGCKMSKSLKNFVTIRDALKKYTARQLRLAFLMHSWKETLDYSDNTMEHAVNYEKMLNEFFMTVKDLSESKVSGDYTKKFKKWQFEDLELNNIFKATKEKIHIALCDNVDTRTVLDKIRECISCCNTTVSKGTVDVQLLRRIATYVTDLMAIFGAVDDNQTIGFPISSKSTDFESTVMPYLRIMGKFRNEVRDAARELKATSILQACDKLRDDTLPPLGVRLEDKEDESGCAVKLFDPQQLERQKELKKKADEQKEQLKAKRLKEQQLKEELKKIPPEEYFKTMKDKYSAFDATGMPTHDENGKEISKNLLKKLSKLYEAHKKEYEEYMKSQS
ncbi:unnamed protein product [Nesidiocoris tenuis]|uniref:Cysteinyl-tRNA synthetase n=2 Tax=Nesidiocoris tenuis TaxID=355587 RepID=A0ABN7B9N9_9HEMI|nr:Cysteinyl-tRNA synthetase [Nesidiocoris tenuis]CAB0008467.1 unnamed protein product [Nesidiocoris tenuis]